MSFPPTRLLRCHTTFHIQHSIELQIMKALSLFTPQKALRLKLLLITFSFLFANSVYSQTATWMGSGADTLASNPASWSEGVVPTILTDVVVPDGTAPLYVDVSLTCASITFLGGAQPSRITVAPG